MREVVMVIVMATVLMMAMKLTAKVLLALPIETSHPTAGVPT